MPKAWWRGTIYEEDAYPKGDQYQGRELRPCPFCKSTNVAWIGMSTVLSTRFCGMGNGSIQCLEQGCGAHGPTRSTPTKAAEAWNRSK